MKKSSYQPTRGEEWANALSHLAGVVATLALAWELLRLAYASSWPSAMGVTFFTVGMLAMYTLSTLYHWWPAGKGKRVLRILDHIGIYVMIAASYTPICLGVVGGWLGWTVFGVLWAVVVGGVFYKVFAIDRLPGLSLVLYLAMGWSIVFIALPVWERTPPAALCCLLAEGFFYTAGTWFFAHDERRYFHAIWHLFVLAGSAAHWMAVWLILR